MSSPPKPFTSNCISIYPWPLVLLKLVDLNANLGPLIQLAFFSKRDGKTADELSEFQRFFSFTYTQNEASVIVDESSYNEYLSETMHAGVSPGWRAIQVYEGPDAIGATGYISYLTQAISSKEGIDIVYLSTFNTDILLVKAEHLERARNCLAASIESYSLNILSATTPKKCEEHFCSKTSPKLVLASFSFDVRILTLHHDDLPEYTHELLKILFFSPEFFSSMTVVRSEVSLILQTDGISDKMSKLQQNEDTWRVIQISEGALGFSGTSVVTPISDALARSQIPQYYLSTFENDYTLVQSRNVNRARECFHVHLCLDLVEDGSSE